MKVFKPVKESLDPVNDAALHVCLSTVAADLGRHIFDNNNPLSLIKKGAAVMPSLILPPHKGHFFVLFFPFLPGHLCFIKSSFSLMCIIRVFCRSNTFQLIRL